MMVMGYAFAEPSVELAAVVDAPAITVVGEETVAAAAVIEAVAAAEDLTAFFGADVADKAVTECIEVVVSASAAEAFKASFTFAAPVADGAVAMLGVTAEGVTTWTELESTVVDGSLEVVFTEAIIAAMQAADSTVLVVLQ